MSAVVIGVDIGGTSTHVIACTPELDVVATRTFATPAKAGDGAMLTAAADAVKHIVSETEGDLTSIGVGAAGVIDHASGLVAVASDSFVGWTGTPVAQILSDRFGVPVSVDNDVNAFVTGEVAVGAARGYDSVLGITLGTGVGGALWSGGALIRGAHGAAGEIGHIPGFGDGICTCGRRGHLETIASGLSIARRYGDLRGTGDGAGLSARAVAAAAHSGDELAEQSFREAGDAIARGILMAAGLVDVETVVVGGGVSRSWNLLKPSIDGRLAAEPPISGHPVTVLQSGLGSRAVALGAAAATRGLVG